MNWLHHFFTVSIFEPTPKVYFTIMTLWFINQQLSIWRLERHFYWLIEILREAGEKNAIPKA